MRTAADHKQRGKGKNIRYKIVFPKFKKGGYTLRQVKVDPTFSEFLACNPYYMHAKKALNA